MLENVAGSITEPVAFTDVEEGSWYADAVAWCSSRGYVTGYGGGIFGVSDPITREQMATILFRYTSSKEDVKDLAAVRGDLSRFADRSSVSDWADEAMRWAVGIRMINGVSADRLDPQGLATRAQTATMLMNYTKTQAEYSDDKADTAS